MTEGQAAPAEGASPLHEAEREELQRLREQENYRERWRKANAAVEEAGVAIDPKRLLPFEESQWPLLIEAAATTSRPFVGATEPPPIVRPSIKPLSARQFFESQYGATE